MKAQSIFLSIIFTAALLISVGCEDSSSDSGGSSGIDSSLVATWLEADASFMNYINNDGIDIRSNGDVYDVDCWFDDPYYYYDCTSYKVAHVDSASGGSISGYNYEESTSFSGTYSFGTAGSLSTMTIHMTSPVSFYEYYIRAN